MSSIKRDTLYNAMRMSIQAAEDCHNSGLDDSCWLWLFRWAECNSKLNGSEKQQAQRKLWQQRGLLERTLANIKACRPLSQGYIRDNLAAALSTVQHMIEHNKQQMRSL